MFLVRCSVRSLDHTEHAGKPMVRLPRYREPEDMVNKHKQRILCVCVCVCVCLFCLGDRLEERS